MGSTGCIGVTFPEILMEVEKHLENGHPRGHLSTSMIVPRSVYTIRKFWQFGVL